MARKPRVEYEGAIYHVMSRGDHGEEVYRNEADNEVFLDTLDEACGRTGWLIHGFVLIKNHYHCICVLRGDRNGYWLTEHWMDWVLGMTRRVALPTADISGGGQKKQCPIGGIVEVLNGRESERGGHLDRKNSGNALQSLWRLL